MKSPEQIIVIIFFKSFFAVFACLSDLTGDAVYMPKDAKRQEYILEKIGRVYKGTFKRISETPWDFGQVRIVLSLGCDANLLVAKYHLYQEQQ